MIVLSIKEEDIEELATGNIVIMHSLYTNDGAFGKYFMKAQTLMSALEEFCMQTKLSVKSLKRRLCLWRASKDYSHIMCNNKPLKKTLNTLALKFPQIIDGMNVRVDSILSCI